MLFLERVRTAQTAMAEVHIDALPYTFLVKLVSLFHQHGISAAHCILTNSRFYQKRIGDMLIIVPIQLFPALKQFIQIP